NTEENDHEPTNSQQTIAAVRAVRNTASFSRVRLNCRYAIAKRIDPKAPKAAASFGVARPNRIAPSTARIRNASGKNDVASRYMTSFIGMSVCSFGSFGASFGLSIDRPIT